MTDIDQPQTIKAPGEPPGSVLRSRGWLLALLAFVLLAGFAAYAFLTWRPPGDGGAEATFARDMQAHHIQAVAMALPLRERSADPELRALALDIMLTQQAQIGQMQGWLAAWGLPLGGAAPPMNGQGEMMGMASQQQVNGLQTLPIPEAEVSFLQLMIRHHQGGVLMAQEALRSTNRPEVVRLAQAIEAAQQSEIEAMEAMLQKRGAAPLPPLQPMDMSHPAH
jgi:uncharacterized protein (DUF305 family)